MAVTSVLAFGPTPTTLVADRFALQLNATDWTQLAPDSNASAIFNVTSAEGDVAPPSGLDSFVNVLVAIVLALLILATAIGNVFVIAVILLERHLQSVANYLILSLAVADLLVACLVMPLGAVYQVTGKWLLGPELCDMWTSSDVLCCTASILHLVAIATDRYWAVTSIDYIQQRTLGRISLMIGAVWLASLVVSCFPLFGWKDDDWHRRIEVFQQCLISQDVGYQVFATLSTFYLPLAIILFLYWRIFLAAKKRIRRRKQQQQQASQSANNHSSVARASSIRGAVSSAAPTVTTTSSAGISLVSSETTSIMVAAVSALGRPIDEDGASVPPDPPSSDNGKSSNGKSRGITRRITSVAAAVASKRRNVESKRERKAAKTLAIITGAFVVCWLPFFVIALLMPVCQPPHCHYDDNMVAFFLWLGYFNSTLNPILYTIFSPEFRNAFQKLLRLNAGQRGGTSVSGRSSRAMTANNNSKFNDLDHQSIAAVSNNYSI